MRCVLTGTLAASLYGAVHDQITLRISPPDLMDWHPRIVPSRDPTAAALLIVVGRRRAAKTAS